MHSLPPPPAGHEAPPLPPCCSETHVARYRLSWHPDVIVRLLWCSLTLVACGEGLAPDSCDRCDELRIRTERSEYRPGAVVRFSMTNLTAAPLRYDWCSMTLASRSTEIAFEKVYLPSRRCGAGANDETVRTHMRVLQPRETTLDSLVIRVAYQGQQRVHVWLLDAEGRPEAVNPAGSNVFLVFPGAEARITGIRESRFVRSNLAVIPEGHLALGSGNQYVVANQ